MKKTIVLLMLLPLCLGALAGCGNRAHTDEMKIADAFISGFSGLYELGGEYTQQGLQLQAAYAYGWAAASVSSMRYCTDCLLYLKGEGKTLEEVAGGRMSDWDEIAAMNYASPYPWFFEGLVYHAENKRDAAEACYEKALVNPAFNSEYSQSLMVLAALNVRELKTVKNKLTRLEDQIYAVFTPESGDAARELLCFDDEYLRARARETLETDKNYNEALRFYQAALAVNPYEGDNFAGCALMCLYLDDADRLFFYVNEGLYVDPGHEGLNQLAGLLNGEAGDA
jgi:tetratricopeptide (TPR) repeat protein